MGTQLVLIIWEKNSGRSGKICIPLASRARNDPCLKCINHFCMRCSVFEIKCNGLKWIQVGGVLWVMLLRVRNKWNLKETDGKNEQDEELWCYFGKKQTRFKTRLRLFNAKYIWSHFFDFFFPPWSLLRDKKAPQFHDLPLSQFPPFWSAITTVCNSIMSHFHNKVRPNWVRRLNQLPNLIIWVDPNWY